MPTALLERLQPVYDERPAAQTMALQAGWPNGSVDNFGDLMAAITAVVVHETTGWPTRDKAAEFVRLFTNGASAGGRHGFGTQFLITGDGTVFRLIDLPRVTYHASFVNTWAVGVETGHLERENDAGALYINRWRALSGDAEDIPGAKGHVVGINGEVASAWWITGSYSGPGRLPTPDRQMLFTEWHYRSWRKLGRYLAETFGIPRNFPLLPYEKRAENRDTADRFRKIVAADSGFTMIVRALGTFNIFDADFEQANLPALQNAYALAVQTPANHKTHNLAWRAYIRHFRGFHGHGFSGAIRASHHDHDCPGDLFDWHRFAREVWDWWWHPFDFNVGGTSTDQPMRPYRQARRDTPLVEYYFDVPEAQYLNRRTSWFQGAPPTPETYQLDAGSRLYAPANGRLIAARYFDTGSNPSFAFILLRHEIYHEADAALAALDPLGHTQPFEREAIDYDLEPTYVYSLIMHLGRPVEMNFDEVTDANPDWLNRVLIRLKECQLGIRFRDGGSTGIANAFWNSRPPGQGNARPTVEEAWRFDRDHNLEDFVDDLKAGRLALGPLVSDDWAMPIEVILGDFLGVAGILDVPSGGPVKHGISIEVFSRDLVSATTFTTIEAQNGSWPVPQPATAGSPAVQYKSEWSTEPNALTKDLLARLGLDASLVNWWRDVASHVLSDSTLPAAAKLPTDGNVWHYRLHDFMRWINRVTWRSEWLKYRVTDAGGTLQPPPGAPRPRRL